MFRCITELKGLIIDIDSFTDTAIEDWAELSKRYKCLFFVSDEKLAKEIIDYYGEKMVYKTERFRKLFAPSPMTHESVLNLLKLQSTEVAYISTNSAFLENAMGFLGGTIWVTDKVSYEEASKAPDLICRGFVAFKNLMLDNVEGFLGETCIFPNHEKRGMIIPLLFEVDGEEIPLYMLGRYFGYSHYMNQLHPYSIALFFNKKEGKSYYRKFDDIFSSLYSKVVIKIQKINEIDGVIAVPPRPGKADRFDKILETISNNCGIENLGDSFICIKDYPTQKKLLSSERRENISGVFKCRKKLAGKNIIIIDDIITTGATIRECIKTLKAGGVNQIFVIVLGINQL